MSAGIVGRNRSAHDHRGALGLPGSHPDAGTAEAVRSDQQDTVPMIVGHCTLPGIPAAASRLVSVRVGNGSHIGPATALMSAFDAGDAETCQLIFDTIRASDLLTSLTELAKLTLAALCPDAFDEDADLGARTDHLMATMGLALSTATIQLPVDPAWAVAYCGDLAIHLAAEPRAPHLVLHDPKVTTAAHVTGALAAHVRTQLGVSIEEQARVWRSVTLNAQGHPARGR